MRQRSAHDRRSNALAYAAVAALLGLTSLALPGCGGPSKSTGNANTPAHVDESQRIKEAINLANQAAKARDPDQAIALYEKSIQVHGEIANVWNNLGVLLMEQNRRQEADNAFANASELAPADPRPPYNRGLLRFQAKYPAESRTFFAASLERDPNYLPALRGAIEADILTRQMSDETLDFIRRALFNERDKRWRERFELHKSRVESFLEDQREQAEARLRTGNPRTRLVPGARE